MKLDIGYTYTTQGSATIEINDRDYLRWCRLNPFNKDIHDEELLTQESRIRGYLNGELGSDKVSNLVGWGEDIDIVWDVDILKEDK